MEERAMSYLLRIYHGDILFEQELELHRSYHIGSKKNFDIFLPELKLDFTIEASEKSWHGDSNDKMLHLAFGNGLEQTMQEIVVLDEKEKVAVSVYQSSPDNTYSIDISNKDTITIGRSSSCNIVLEDRRVSGYHLKLYRQDNKWRFIDNGSSNGTYLNERKTNNGALKDEDVLTVGFCRLIISNT